MSFNFCISNVPESLLSFRFWLRMKKTSHGHLLLYFRVKQLSCILIKYGFIPQLFSKSILLFIFEPLVFKNL